MVQPRNRRLSQAFQEVNQTSQSTMITLMDITAKVRDMDTVRATVVKERAKERVV